MAKTHKIERLNPEQVPEYLITLAQFSKKLVLRAIPLGKVEPEYVLIDIPGVTEVTYEDFAEENGIFFWYRTVDNSAKPSLSNQQVISLHDLILGLLPIDDKYSDRIRQLARVIAITEAPVLKEFLSWCKSAHEHRYPTTEEAMEYLLNF